MRKFSLYFLLTFFPLVSIWPQLDHIQPPFWWTGMDNSQVQLLLHGSEIGELEATISGSEAKIVEVHRVENPNYLFLDIEIPATTKAGEFEILLKGKGKSIRSPYELKERVKKDDRTGIRGLGPEDFIYLIMPDRFANGEPSNDNPKMNEMRLNRSEMFHRHGGDLQGVTERLDYMEDLGVTAIWLNPVVTNDQPDESYHGYAATDHYDVDPRFGGMKEYMRFVEEAHKRDIKVVVDVIHNHMGNEHWLFKDLPEKSWVHQWEEFTRTSYRAPTIFDPYASDYDKNIMLNGWFDHHMPDLDQSNELLANYLIQNNIWWIEYAQVDAFRMDTYAYSDPGFLEKWGKAILAEYPDFGIFGETWVHGAPVQAYFHGANKVDSGFDSNLPGLTDFQLYYAINEALEGKFGWTEGVSRIYYTLAKDYLYEDATRNVLFLDNHDLSRFYSMVKEDIKKYKMGISFLMTMRGIPCMYYGTEILMKNYADPDGKVREDFPGGWEGDTINKFDASGRTVQENEAFDFVRDLANYRKENSVLHTGKLTHFIPNQGTYTYFRQNEEKTLMISMNTTDEDFELDTNPMRSLLPEGEFSFEIIPSGEKMEYSENMIVPAWTTLILEVQEKR